MYNVLCDLSHFSNESYVRAHKTIKLHDKVN